jgi:hypothetical protein
VELIGSIQTPIEYIQTYIGLFIFV